MRNQQLNRNPCPNIILGDCDKNILKVDLDNCFSIRQAKHVGRMVKERFNMDGFLILQSSIKTHAVRNVEGDKIVYRYKTKGYHIVFNRGVSESENKAILSWLCLHLKNNWGIAENLDMWFHMQCIKETFTLRHGFKGKRIRPPRPVKTYGNQDKMIAKYLENREYILNLLKKESKKVKQK